MSEWQPIATAPKDGSYILAIVAPNDSRHMGHLAGRMFCIRHEGRIAYGYDLGWAVFPGYGGAPDSYFTHWTPLPAPPAIADRNPKGGDLLGSVHEGGDSAGNRTENPLITIPPPQVRG